MSIYSSSLPTLSYIHPFTWFCFVKQFAFYREFHPFTRTVCFREVYVASEISYNYYHAGVVATCLTQTTHVLSILLCCIYTYILYLWALQYYYVHVYLLHTHYSTTITFMQAQNFCDAIYVETN